MIKYKLGIHDTAGKLIESYTGVVDATGKATIQIPAQAGMNGKINIEWRYDGNYSNTESESDQT